MKTPTVIKTFVLKVAKILFLLLLTRFMLYVPVPSLDLHFLSTLIGNPISSYLTHLTCVPYMGIGSLGLIPYMNSSLTVQLLSYFSPELKSLKKEGGEFSKKQIAFYTRRITLLWAVFLSITLTFIGLKPMIPDLPFTSLVEITISLTMGSFLCAWFGELISEEGLGNGFSMIVAINILGNMRNSVMLIIHKAGSIGLLYGTCYVLSVALVIGFIFFLVGIFQTAYKKVPILFLKHLPGNSFSELSSFEDLNYIPFKLNQSGPLPLVASSFLSKLVPYSLEIFSRRVVNISPDFLPTLLMILPVVVKIIVIMFISILNPLLAFKPGDISQELLKSSCVIPKINPGNQTTEYLKQVINRLAVIAGLILVGFAFLPDLLELIFHGSVIKNITPFFVLVTTYLEISSQVRGYLLSAKYERKF